MANYKECRAIVLPTATVDALVITAVDTNGLVEREGTSLSYHACFNSEAEIIRFKDWMMKLGIPTDGRVFFCGTETVIPEDVSLELLGNRLDVKRIWRTFVDKGDQVILIDD